MQILKSSVLILLMLFSFHAQATSEEWYVILGSFPISEKGLKEAKKLKAKFPDDFKFILGESNYFEGLAEELYVVMAGAFQTQKEAKQWIAQNNIKQIVRDAYVKKAIDRRP